MNIHRYFNNIRKKASVIVRNLQCTYFISSLSLLERMVQSYPTSHLILSHALFTDRLYLYDSLKFVQQ